MSSRKSLNYRKSVNDCDNVHLRGNVSRKPWQYGGYAWQLTVCAASRERCSRKTRIVPRSGCKKRVRSSNIAGGAGLIAQVFVVGIGEMVVSEDLGLLEKENGNLFGMRYGEWTKKETVHNP